MDIHKKQKGSLGAIKVIEDLIKRGIEVFIEFGDNSRVDLIALVNKKTIRIQVKAITSDNGSSVFVSSVKKGPNYEYRYEIDDCDLFAVYVLDQDILFYLTPEQLLRNKTGLRIRLKPTKNGQTNKTNKIEIFQTVLEDVIHSLSNASV